MTFQSQVVGSDAEAATLALRSLRPWQGRRFGWSFCVNDEGVHLTKKGYSSITLGPKYFFLNKLLGGVYFLKPLEHSNVYFVTKDVKEQKSAWENFRK